MDEDHATPSRDTVPDGNAHTSAWFNTNLRNVLAIMLCLAICYLAFIGRKDWSHKVTTEIVTTSKNIFVGDVSSSKLARTTMAKSVYDASWNFIRTFLRYKATKLGRAYHDVNERCSSCRCSVCLRITGPRGLRQLGVREWVCSHCGSFHDRDVNAAQNILRMGHHTLIKGILVL